LSTDFDDIFRVSSYWAYFETIEFWVPNSLERAPAKGQNFLSTFHPGWHCSTASKFSTI